MTATTSATGSQLTGRGGIRREVVAALAVTTTVGYGVLYYAFSALLDQCGRTCTSPPPSRRVR